MSFGLIHKQRRFREQLGTPEFQKNPLSELNTADPIFSIKEAMDGSKEAIYHVNLIFLMDKVFTRDNLRFISIDQERFMSKFFNEAGIATDALHSGTDPYANMDDVMIQLDNFLGSYFGVNYGRFAGQR
jgi:hypothetical protein